MVMLWAAAVHNENACSTLKAVNASVSSSRFSKLCKQHQLNWRECIKSHFHTHGIAPFSHCLIWIPHNVWSRLIPGFLTIGSSHTFNLNYIVLLGGVKCNSGLFQFGEELQKKSRRLYKQSILRISFRQPWEHLHIFIQHGECKRKII